MSNENAPTAAHPAAAASRTASRLKGRFDEAVLAVCRRLLTSRTRGRLRLTLPSGAQALITGRQPGADAELVLHTYQAFWKSLKRGSIGFAESYMDGDCETPDLKALFEYFIDNRAGLTTAGRGYFRVRAQDRRFHASRANTRSGSKANITAHYDLGNAFYAAWLDPSMTYSSAFYETPHDTLEQAQRHKIARVLGMLGIEQSHRVLEIGCGWGALAEAMADHGARVVGLTLSHEQHDEARRRLSRAGLTDQTDIRLQDYRDVDGAYDRVVSIEMIEAVGEENWPAYFATLHDRLVPGGVAVIQAITIDDAIFDTYRRKADFIQRYIFPGGMLPTKAIIADEARRAGLTLEASTTFGLSYARTLREWRHRFEAAWPQIATMGFDQKFRRMWLYYLAYCEAGFEKGTVDVGLYRLVRRPAQDA